MAPVARRLLLIENLDARTEPEARNVMIRMAVVVWLVSFGKAQSIMQRILIGITQACDIHSRNLTELFILDNDSILSACCVGYNSTYDGYGSGPIDYAVPIICINQKYFLEGEIKC